MRALRVTRNGAPSEALSVEAIDLPAPGLGQVRIQVAAASLMHEAGPILEAHESRKTSWRSVVVLG